MNNRLLFCIALLTVSGCTSNYTPNLSRMSSSYAQALSQYQTDIILMNIVRASEERPLSFLDIPSINGTGNVNTSVSLGLGAGGISTGNFAGAVLSATPASAVGYGTTFTFTQSSLDNATFWKGILTPIPLKVAYNFRTSRTPKELLFSLLIDSIEIKEHQRTNLYLNNPLDSSYTGFVDHFNHLLSAGLEIGTKKIKKEIEFDLCLKPNAENRITISEFHQDTYCEPEQKSTGNATFGNKQISFKIRSPKMVFNYLGDVVTAQLGDPSLLVILKPTTETKSRKAGQVNQYALFVVNKNPPSTMQSLSSFNTPEGIEYAIPKDNNGYSAQVIDIMSQMITLSKIAGSIPQQPAVLIK